MNGHYGSNFSEDVFEIFEGVCVWYQYIVTTLDDVTKF